MAKLTFTTTAGWRESADFGCASLGLAGLCNNSQVCASTYPLDIEGISLTGSYQEILSRIPELSVQIHGAIVLFGNAGGENAFIAKLLNMIRCPMVGGGAAIDPDTGKRALISGGGEAAVFLITDDRYIYETRTQCIHENILETCELELQDLRTISKINGMDAVEYLTAKKCGLGIAADDFEHMTLSDLNHVNAHLSVVDGVVKSGRDLCARMLLRSVDHADVYERMRAFYDDPDAIIFGCAGLSGLLDRPLQTNSLGLFLFGEVCTTANGAEFGNLMLSKLIIKHK